MAIAITGNTYPVREQLKALGARWNAAQKAWMVDETKAQQANAIVSGAGPKKAYNKYAAQSGGWRGNSRGCSCDCDECSGRCRCESHCNCRGGNVYDC